MILLFDSIAVDKTRCSRQLCCSLSSVVSLVFQCSVSDLVGVFEFEAGDDLTLQLIVGRRLVQDGLTELWDVCFAGLPQHRVQPVVCKHTHTHKHTHTQQLFLLSFLSFLKL